MSQSTSQLNEIFAAVTETFLDPLFVPIQFETNRETRIATLKGP